MDGRLLTFGVSGKLIMNGLVMYDKETGSLWSQVLGQGVDGPLKDRALTVIPALQTTWERWLTDHPDTLVLDKGGRYLSDSYSSYYAGRSKGILGESRNDARLAPKALVLGVTIGEQHRAYSFSALAEEPVLNDTVDGVPVLVTFDGASSTGGVFDPLANGRVLTFRRTEGVQEFLMEDVETGTVWDPISGVGLEGPLQERTLRRLPAHYEFWFSWKDFRPNTDLYAGAGGTGG